MGWKADLFLYWDQSSGFVRWTKAASRLAKWLDESLLIFHRHPDPGASQDIIELIDQIYKKRGRRLDYRAPFGGRSARPVDRIVFFFW